MKKLKQSKGFTLVEMLACTVTLFLICMICSGGMNLALRSYEQSVFESDSQMLESTLNTYIRDVLRHATDIQVNDTTDSVIFTNDTYGIYDGEIMISDDGYGLGGEILIYQREDDAETPILSEDAYAKTLYISDKEVDDFVITYDEDTKLFTVSYIIKSTILEDAARECSFTCRTIAEYRDDNN